MRRRTSGPARGASATLSLDGLAPSSDEHTAGAALLVDRAWWALAVSLANGVALATMGRLWGDRAMLFMMQQKASSVDQASSSAADEASAHTANIRSTVHRFVDDLEANSKTCVLVFIRGLHPETLLARAQL